MKTYNGPGKYIAICNRIMFDGHYTERFEVPQSDQFAGVSASWYFLNVVNLTACLEAIYPEEIFTPLFLSSSGGSCYGPDNGEEDPIQVPVEVEEGQYPSSRHGTGSCYDDNDEAPMGGDLSASRTPFTSARNTCYRVVNYPTRNSMILAVRAVFLATGKGLYESRMIVEKGLEFVVPSSKTQELQRSMAEALVQCEAVADA